MSITHSDDEIISEIQIAAPPERVFQALVDPLQVPKWWGQIGRYRCERFTADLRIGGRWQSSGPGPDGRDFQVSGEYLEIDPPRLLVSTWTASWTGALKTTVRWELTPSQVGTRVRIRHCGLAAQPGATKSYQGWPRMLDWLKRFLDHGETVDSRGAS
jgi:uncharacterized protein YndB with AHSA1/START domain